MVLQYLSHFVFGYGWQKEIGNYDAAHSLTGKPLLDRVAGFLLLPATHKGLNNNRPADNQAVELPKRE